MGLAQSGPVPETPGVRAGLGTSTRITVAEAAREAAHQARQRIGGRVPDAAIVVATAAWGAQAIRELAAAVAEEMGCEPIAGSSVDGLLAGEGWAAHRPALAVLAIAGVEAYALQADGVAGRESRVGAEWAAELPGDPGRQTARTGGARSGDALIVFSDSLGLAPAPLLEGLGAAMPGVTIAGIGASEPPGGEPLVWAGAETSRGACSALFLRCDRPPAMAVTHGCRVVGDVLEVTRARGHWVYGLSGRPALEVLRERLGATADVPRPAGTGPLVGLLDREGEMDATGPVDAPLIRNVAGIDEASGGFALAEAVSSGTRLALLELAPEAAEREVGQRVGAAVAAARADRSPACGLYFTCRAAGDLLLEAAVRDRRLASALAGAPLLGVSSAFQLAPSSSPGAPPRLHTYSGVVALLG